MFKVRTKKNHDHIMSYPKVDEELSVNFNIDMVQKWVDDITYDYEDFREGIFPEHMKDELNNFNDLKIGEYSFNCGDFTYYIEIS